MVEYALCHQYLPCIFITFINPANNRAGTRIHPICKLQQRGSEYLRSMFYIYDQYTMKLALNRALTVPKATVFPPTPWSSVWGMIQNHLRSTLGIEPESCLNAQESNLLLWLCVLIRTNKQTKPVLTVKNPSTLGWSNLHILKDSLQSSKLTLVLYCHVTHRPKTHRLLTTRMYRLPFNPGRGSGRNLILCLWLRVSQEVVATLSAELCSHVAS